MVSNFSFTPIYPTQEEKSVGKIYVSGVSPEVIGTLRACLQQMDESVMLHTYCVEASEGKECSLTTTLNDELTGVWYEAKCDCSDSVSGADLANFIAKCELELKQRTVTGLRALALNSPFDFVDWLTGFIVSEGIVFRPIPTPTPKSTFGVISSVLSGFKTTEDPFLIAAKKLLKENYTENWVENFVLLCNIIYNNEGDTKYLRTADKAINDLLKRICNQRERKMVDFWRKHSPDRGMFKKFIYECMDPNELAKKATVQILIRRRKQEDAVDSKKKTFGNYLIFTVKNGKEKLLDLRETPIYIYMLMYLINHVQEPARKTPLDLFTNKQVFENLFKENYGEYHGKDIEKQIQEYYKRPGHGARRSTWHSTIAAQLQANFEEYGESYLPYGITGLSHMMVPADKIVIEESIKEHLLDYKIV